MKLQGKKALITGGGRGLGKAMALALAREGAHVVLVSRSIDQLKQTAAEAGNATVFSADVTDEASVAKLAQDVGPIDILINNAGINLRKNLVDFTLDEWNSVMDTNVTSVFLMCRAFVPGMKGKGYGRIINRRRS
jgi:NAD(P)-dependent dehydrogenase (short-subunit alcohol dehydrogenase family)